MIPIKFSEFLKDHRVNIEEIYFLKHNFSFFSNIKDIYTVTKNLNWYLFSHKTLSSMP